MFMYLKNVKYCATHIKYTKFRVYGGFHDGNKTYSTKVFGWLIIMCIQIWKLIILTNSF